MAELKLCIYPFQDAVTLVNLWHACFPSDSFDYAYDFLQAMPEDTIVTVGELENRPVTMALLLPATARFRGECFAVRYLYAGCTHPDARGNGYYRQLMMFAEDTVRAGGECAIYLHPSDEKLEQSYQRMGYMPGIAGSTGDLCDQTSTPITRAEYMHRRQCSLEQMAQHTVVFDPTESAVSFFLKDCMFYSDNTSALATYDGVILEQCGMEMSQRFGSFCLWLPTNQTSLNKYIHQFGGRTGVVGE